MISPYDYSTNPDVPSSDSCFWMKIMQWKSNGKAKIMSAWGYNGGIDQALYRWPKWKGTLQMNGSGKGKDEKWSKEMTPNKNGLVPTGRSDPFASAHTLVAAMILLNLLF
jgi:hypothetical protein